jgi:hypothetical protein
VRSTTFPLTTPRADTPQVMPFYSGAHAVIGGPFTILRFTERDLPDLVYPSN